MSTPTEQRELAIAASEGVCPRCGAPRATDQEYCVECGLRLPPVTGRLPGLRRRWIRRLGWYPGDWIWISLLTLIVAVAGAAVAIAITHHERSSGAQTSVAPTAPHLTVGAPTPAPPPASTQVETATLPAAPEPTTTAAATPRNGSFSWPADQSGWTIVLVSYPKTIGQAAARTTAAKAARAGLPQVGVLDSSSYVSLQPGYLVVFTGIYDLKDGAATALATAQAAGFASAYVRQVAR